MNDSTLDVLRRKHPPTPFRLPNTTPPGELSCCPTISEEAVILASHSFPKGSAGSPDGLLPQHLKDLTGLSAESGGPVLLSALNLPS